MCILKVSDFGLYIGQLYSKRVSTLSDIFVLGTVIKDGAYGRRLAKTKLKSHGLLESQSREPRLIKS